jgi:hypothetical protein
LTADREKMKKANLADHMAADQRFAEADKAPLVGEVGDWYMVSYREAMSKGVDGALDDLESI